MKITRYITILMMLIATATYAQKQPQIQQGSVRAPENIKIDGKLDEWPSPNLSAYNPANRIFYVIANDDRNLYFTIRGLGNGVAKKMVAGGMIITISPPGDKKKDMASISYPLPQDPKNVEGIMGVLNQILGWTDDPVANRKQIDSIADVASHVVNTIVTEIGIKGIKDIADPAISKYNEFGIKAAMRFTKLQPVVELCIPLKLLGLSTDNPGSFKYNIKLNQIPESSAAFAAPVINDANGNPVATPVNANVGFALNTTDFSGEYTLAKKP